MSSENTDLYALWDEFLKLWPVDRVRSMSLEEYTNAGSKDTFTYWIESQLDKMGSIWGGSSFKFGVYSRNATEAKEPAGKRMYSDDYGWLSKYGESSGEAFLVIRGEIVKIIEAVNAENTALIDEVDLGQAYKWKIAFHYQNKNKPLIVPVFASKLLSELTGKPLQSPASVMHAELIAARPVNEDLLEYGKKLWVEYERLITVSESDEVPEEYTEKSILPFYSGLTIGSGSNEYRVKRVTLENVELIKTSSGVERFIPTVVMKALCGALDSGTIQIDDLHRRQNGGNEHVFEKIGFMHDKFILGYDASIIKLCEFFMDHRTGAANIDVSSIPSTFALTSVFPVATSAVFCAAAMSKRFTIFTGLSGSGKTLQALSFAKWICPKKTASFYEKLKVVLESDKIAENYEVHSCSAQTVELVNKRGNSGKIIPLPVGAIEEWYHALRDGVIDGDKDPKDTRHTVGEGSAYQKYIHGFYTELKKLGTAVLELPAQATGSDGPPQYELISVGADWTSNENLLGYPDALNPQHYRKPDNGALDLILRAQANPDLPHFLILDEMNLSHVERYFADFLSAMESGEAISLHDDTGSDWSAGGTVKVPAKLTIPKNLFVIGTVNVDETTYMFSPKVLDRANVIEFRVSDDEMKLFLSNPVKPDLESIAGQGAHYAKAFVSAAKQKDFKLDEQAQVSDVLMQFFPELKEAGAEFGYRTAHEISRFVYFHKELSKDWKFEKAMDAAIMQKLLPKLHGSKKKLGPVLASLIRLCLKAEARPENDPIKDEVLIPENALYPASLEKLARMRKRLAEHGFTSFAEA